MSAMAMDRRDESGWCAGVGKAAFDFGTAAGAVRAIRRPADVVALLRNAPAQPVIALIDDCGATFLAPILPTLEGIICTTGNPQTHLGIVAREYQLPCVFATLTRALPDGTAVRISSSGDEGRIDHVGDRA